MRIEKIRVAIVALLALVMLASIALFRPVEGHGVPEASFWNGKFSGAGEFDVVAAGDSRTLYAVNMEPFEKTNLGRGMNFGFRGAALDSEFLDSAVELLSSDGKKILVLGVTPNAFTANSLASNGFHQKRDEYKDSVSVMPQWWIRLLQQYQPLTLGELGRLARGKKNPLQKTYHPNGWIASDHRKPNEDSALRFYKVRFDGNPVQAKLIDAACQSVKQFREQGIRVFAFKPPVADAMTALENDKSGFVYEEFVEQFTAAGGVWLDVDPASYSTYDGSHLQSESAVKLSQWLASQIADRIGVDGDGS